MAVKIGNFLTVENLNVRFFYFHIQTVLMFHGKCFRMSTIILQVVKNFLWKVSPDVHHKTTRNWRSSSKIKPSSAHRDKVNVAIVCKKRWTWKYRKNSHTVWKFHYFSITKILRKINFGDFRSAKSAILTHLEALNFEVYEFFALF